MSKSSNMTSNTPPEIIQVEKDVNQVACDGGLGPLGHPLTYYSFKDNKDVRCGYCDRVFTKNKK